MAIAWRRRPAGSRPAADESIDGRRPGAPPRHRPPRSLAPSRGGRAAIGSALSRAIGLDPEATALPPRGRGVFERVRAPVRRAAEILAYRQRVRPWAAAVVAAVPADIYSAKALVALPVVREAAHRDRRPLRLRHRRSPRGIWPAGAHAGALQGRTCPVVSAAGWPMPPASSRSRIRSPTRSSGASACRDRPSS